MIMPTILQTYTWAVIHCPLTWCNLGPWAIGYVPSESEIVGTVDRCFARPPRSSYSQALHINIPFCHSTQRALHLFGCFLFSDRCSSISKDFGPRKEYPDRLHPWKGQTSAKSRLDYSIDYWPNKNLEKPYIKTPVIIPVHLHVATLILRLYQHHLHLCTWALTYLVLAWYLPIAPGEALTTLKYGQCCSLSIWAILIEVLQRLDTSCFIISMRRFIAIRVPVK